MIDRRGFLREGTRATVGLSLLGGPAVIAQERSPRTSYLASKTAEWEQGIPRWLRDARMPGASMTLFDAGKILWERPFGLKDAATGEPVRATPSSPPARTPNRCSLTPSSSCVKRA